MVYHLANNITVCGLTVISHSLKVTRIFTTLVPCMYLVSFLTCEELGTGYKTKGRPPFAVVPCNMDSNAASVT